MSIVSDDLFADKIKQLQALKNEINQDRDEVHKVLGEWLANALADDNNHELQTIFLDAHDNPKYLRLKKNRALLSTLATKMRSEAKLTSSKFIPPKQIQDNQEKLSFDDTHEDELNE